MATEGQRGTNAADSAPGVDDGRPRDAEPRHFSRPGGRRAVWIGVGVVLLILLVTFLARPREGVRPAVLPEPERFGGTETVIPYEGQQPQAPASPQAGQQPQAGAQPQGNPQP